MVATAMGSSRKLVMTDLSGQRRFESDLSYGLSPQHTISQAVDYYLDEKRIQRNGLDFLAFSRGVRLDGKRRIADLPAEDLEMTVMPEVAAG
jgi:hypothetical protein